MEEVPPVTSRVRGKRPATRPLPDMESEGEEDEDMPDRAPSQPSQWRRRGQPRSDMNRSNLATAWWSDVDPGTWEPEASAYWTQEEAAVEVEIALPETKAAWSKKATQNLQSYFVGALKRKAVEVSERKLTPEQKEKFRGAKSIEVRNFIAAKTFEALPEHIKPEQAISMRCELSS